MKLSTNRNAIKPYDTPPMQVLLPGRSTEGRAKASERTTYYGRPMVKSPYWKGYIPLYFFLGGVAAGAAFFGALADLFGGKRHRSTVRHARYLSLALAAICPILLILDLGRPKRFLHMLRIVKVSSPLNLGTYILMGFGITSGILAARQAAEDGFILKRNHPLGRLALLLPEKPFTVLHALFGMALGGYTGVLLALTAVPLWAAAGILLGPLFLAASITSGSAALVLIGLLSRHQSRAAREDLQVVATVGSFAQLGLAAAHEVLVPERISRPLWTGRWGNLFRFGTLGGGLGVPLVLRLLARLSGKRLEPVFSFGASVFTLLGTLAERFALVEAGKISSQDPLAYQELTSGAPGEARPTPAQQARRAPAVPKFARGLAARDTVPGGATGEQ